MPKNGLANNLKISAATAFAARAIGKILCRDVDSFIFVANTGRCGSDSLSRILAAIPNARSLHEPHPRFLGEILCKYNNELDLDLFRKTFYYRKIPNILWAAKGQSVYIETNHSFIKSYCDEAARYFGDQLKLIWLFRNKNDVALSYFRRHTSAGAEKEKELMRHWLLDPGAKRNLLRSSAKICGSGEFSHPIYKYIWYCYELDARTLDFSKKYPNVKVVLLPMEHLSDEKRIFRLCSELGISKPVGLHGIVGQKYNASAKKPEWPKEVRRNDLLTFHRRCQQEIIRSGLGDSELYRKAKMEMEKQDPA